jgi:hypothetical protein
VAAHKYRTRRTHPRELAPRAWESECVASLEYDLESQKATVHFMKRGSYAYFDVPPEEYANFNNAGSRGTYFNLYVRDRYEYERIG